MTSSESVEMEVSVEAGDGWESLVIEDDLSDEEFVLIVEKLGGGNVIITPQTEEAHQEFEKSLGRLPFKKKVLRDSGEEIGRLTLARMTLVGFLMNRGNFVLSQYLLIPSSHGFRHHLGKVAFSDFFQAGVLILFILPLISFSWINRSGLDVSWRTIVGGAVLLFILFVHPFLLCIYGSIVIRPSGRSDRTSRHLNFRYLLVTELLSPKIIIGLFSSSFFFLASSGAFAVLHQASPPKLLLGVLAGLILLHIGWRYYYSRANLPSSLSRKRAISATIKILYASMSVNVVGHVLWFSFFPAAESGLYQSYFAGASPVVLPIIGAPLSPSALCLATFFCGLVGTFANFLKSPH